MKAIFLCEQGEVCFKVYDSETLASLRSLADIEPRAYCKDDVIENKEKFRDTEVIFSTWGMPTFTEDEIRFLALNVCSMRRGAYSSSRVPFWLAA